ncbi:amino acid adenylation domain-containing protein [Streptomyces sp. NPDC087658]|uniref:non-ribosomal peptide synthetase n=1 Tax=Streptomyces sp. NPDC087658 TaxID=3365800 RepID=UPI0037F642D9
MDTRQTLPALPAIQRSMWLACQLEPDLPVYNEAEAFRLDGPVDRPALVRALDELYLRHPALRSVVRADADGLPHVATQPSGRFPLEELDLRGRPPQEAHRLGVRAAEDAARRVFDLAAGPLARACLIRCADEQWILVLVLHHLVCDGDSFRVLVEELGVLYEGGVLVPPAQDPVQAQHLLQVPAEDPVARADLDYWRGRLADLPDRLAIPADRSLSAHTSHLGRLIPLALDDAWFEGTQATAAALHASPFAVVAAAVSIVLGRLARTKDLVVGTTVNMRSEAEAEELVGYFMKVVPLRLRVDEADTADALVRQAQTTVLDAMTHTSVEFDELVSALGRPATGHSPLFQVALELHYESGLPHLAGVTSAWLPLDTGTSKFDFTFHLSATPGRPSHLEFRTELYDEATARSLAQAVTSLLGRLCAQPHRVIGELPLLDEADLALLEPWERGPALPQEDLGTLSAELRERATLHPDRPAVVYGGERLSYAELVHRADLLGDALAAAGVAPADIVGVAMRRSAAQIGALLGTWSAGAVCAALDPGLPEDRLRRMMSAVGIRTVLVDADTGSLPAFADVRRIPAHPEALPDAGRPTAPPTGSPTAPAAEVSPQDLAYLIFTSGTSGDPKPVAIRHLSLSAFGRAMDQLVYGELPGHARVAVNAPFSFDASWQGVQLLHAGHTIYPVPDSLRADPQAMVTFLRDNTINALDGTPTHVAALTDAGLLDPRQHVPDVLVVGGEAMPARLWRQLARGGTRAVNVYGPTEFTVNATGCPIEDVDQQPVIGHPLAGVTAQVLDSGLRPVPIGFPGELYLSGPQLAVGYLGQPERTAERFLELRDGQRVYSTGDLVRRRGNGHLEFLRRLDGQVKLRGYRIEPAEIAAVLRSAPSVRDAAVVVVGQGTPSAALHAALTMAEPMTTIDQVHAFTAARLPAYMVPATFTVLPQLPRTPSGKLDVARVVALRGTRPRTPSASTESTPTRRRMAAIWSQLLGCEDVDDGDDFFALGGHSLLASRLVRRVEAEFGVRLPLQTVFGRRTLAAMADALDAGSAPGGARAATDSRLVVPLSAGADRGMMAEAGAGGRPPLVVLHPLGGSLFAYEPLLRLLPSTLEVWGLRSPTVAGAGPEPADVESLAARYADELVRAVPALRLTLFGWSLGGLICLAVAAELEARGIEIDFVEMWDCGVGTEEPLGDRESLRMALRATYGAPTEPRTARVLTSAVDLVPEGARVDDVLLRAVQERTRPLGATSDTVALPRHFEVIRQQTELFRDWVPTPVHAPLHAVYSRPSLLDGSVARTDWRRFTTAPWTESTVSADHYAMMRSPAVAECAQGLLTRLALAERVQGEHAQVADGEPVVANDPFFSRDRRI